MNDVRCSSELVEVLVVTKCDRLEFRSVLREKTAMQTNSVFRNVMMKWTCVWAITTYDQYH